MKKWGDGVDVGGRIKQLREEKGWTTNFLATQCGISQSFLRSVELGDKGITVEYLSFVCGALNISLKDFFDIPTDSDTPDDILYRKIQALTVRQRAALSDFLDTVL